MGRKIGDKERLDVGLDVDGVLRNTFVGIAYAYLLGGGHKLYKWSDFTDYDFTKMMDIDKKEEFFRKYAETIFLKPRPMPYTHLVSKLAEDNNIHIVTSQFKGLENLTIDWLQKHNIPYDTIHFTWDKSQVNLDVLLDDLPKNLYSMPQNTIKVCYDAPYNHYWKGNRVHNMKEFVEFINKMNNDKKEAERLGLIRPEDC